MHMVESVHIKRLREILEISQTTLGNFVGVTQNTVARWEGGDRFPSRKHVQKMYDLAEENDVNFDRIISSINGRPKAKVG